MRTPGRRPKIPLTIVAGPLGAGKTRLVNRLIAHPAFAGTAVILNEFGATELVGEPAETAGDGYVALGGGCVCCSVRGELIGALERLLRANDNGRLEVRRVIVEAEAAADPGAVLGGILRHPYLSMRYRPAGVIVLLPENAGTLEAPPLGLQLAAADMVVLPGGGASAPDIARVNAFAGTVSADSIDPSSMGDFPFWQGRPADPAAAAGGAYASIDLSRPEGLDPANAARLMEDLAISLGTDVVRLLLATSRDGTRTVARVLGGALLPAIVAENSDCDNGTRLQAIVRSGSAAALADRFDIHLGGIAVDRPDRAALLDNPLAVAGFSARPGKR